MRKTLVALAATGALGVAAIPATAATSTILLKDNFFSPKTKTIKKGDTVKFVWKGKAPHNVKGTGYKSAIKRTGSYSRRYTKAGRFNIVCTIHSGMKLVLTVK